ncbi:MAG: hypothetical protein N2690_02175 [Rhodocyclaceae bacterium]|nr:hypothetical protein [Rhodocyclaceae bacterium]
MSTSQLPSFATTGEARARRGAFFTIIAVILVLLIGIIIGAMLMAKPENAGPAAGGTQSAQPATKTKIEGKVVTGRVLSAKNGEHIKQDTFLLVSLETPAEYAPGEVLKILRNEAHIADGEIVKRNEQGNYVVRVQPLSWTVPQNERRIEVGDLVVALAKAVPAQAPPAKEQAGGKQAAAAEKTSDN